ncbi:hypothetical protein ANTRET_LOCUS4197 [Anthophora retusa]
MNRTHVDTTLCGGLKYPNQFHRMTRENLRVISPGGISLLRLILGLVVRMPIPRLLVFPVTAEREREREREREARERNRNRKRERERERETEERERGREARERERGERERERERETEERERERGEREKQKERDARERERRERETERERCERERNRREREREAREREKQKRERERGREREKSGEFNMKQHRNVSNIRDIRSRIHTRDEWKRLGGSLMAKFSIRQTSVRGNGSSFSRRGEPNTPGS